ncbi:hypothetical protein GLOTRDRAFT_102407 [Gloeophyllum trabeum ATCC 11539]|uniref:Alpha/beta hydrolase fold-3 domain-containing protein n=1 Tax=Gloeophyllum trabeum (strain ATCC 11539 / FP-39264 / Madison 617) TaxID=670483 RepID=S7QM73_GLOTA|nr:uncharacterized protein GLOTRDRAFT_102407 [Gloeophyllum trabeum ATCC 11539]EPQ60666.1 hypothetical protein GLOTRDRAFT_102407 [Gloeophyllum trabeum ATCC 11539]
MQSQSVVYQPLYEDIVARLDPEYVAFHKEHMLYKPLQHQRPWNPDIRKEPNVPGNTSPLQVGSVRDLSVGRCMARVFKPEGAPPEGGWPVLLYFHGGTSDPYHGFPWRAKCVVVSVDYRLAPENPYPAAVEDAVESLQWLYTHGKAELTVNTKRIAVGGSSSGGNLAAILALKAAEMTPPIPLVFQMLFVPVTDNLANPDGDPHASWYECRNTVWLSPARMLWFRNNYLPKAEDRGKWDASPLFAPDELVRKTPKAWIALCELDILRDEGTAYGEKLQKAGVDVEVKVYKGAPHHITNMDGAVTQLGRDLISDAVQALGVALGTL